MKQSRIHLHWEDKDASVPFQTAVSLHSHTSYSRESLDFIERATAQTPWLSGAIRKQAAKYRALKGRDLDLKRAWWTPPLSPREAWHVESAQIEDKLGKAALVSLSDHDTIDACLHLHILEERHDCPISVEWTVPFQQTFFHLGVHNMPLDSATVMMRELEAFTTTPKVERIAPLLEWLGKSPETLLVLNHPLWDENHIGEENHRESVEAFITQFGNWLHALELNGLRPSEENKRAAQLARTYNLPVVSGGDRHGHEPNACVNLSNATSFEEFVDEVRRDARSEVLFMPQYREPLKLRILENICDILGNHTQHEPGLVEWSDRVFYLTDEGEVKSLKTLWGKRFPNVVRRFVGLVGLLKHRQVRGALRSAVGLGRRLLPTRLYPQTGDAGTPNRLLPTPFQESTTINQ